MSEAPDPTDPFIDPAPDNARAEDARAPRAPRKPAPKRKKPRANLAVWEPIIRIGYVIAVAVAVALLSTRVNRGRAAELAGVEPGVDPLLLQPVKTVDVNMTALRWAVESLAKASPVRVELDPDSFAGQADREPAADGPPPRPLRLKGRTVGDAVSAILARFDRPDFRLTYVVENGWVIIGRADKLATRDKPIVRAYDVGDLLARAQTSTPQSLRVPDVLIAPIAGSTGPDRIGVPDDPPPPPSPGELVDLVVDAMTPTGTSGSDSKLIRLVDRWLIVQAPPQAQRDVQRLLFILRNGDLIIKDPPPPSTRNSQPATRNSPK